MRWFINDASLQGQFESIAEFEPILRSMLELRKTEPAYSNLFVTRAFGEQQVMPGQTLAHVVRALSDRDFRVRVLQWVSQRGPFLDDERTEEENDYFECLGTDVTDQGLGEAARRVARKLLAGSWSFVGGRVNFAQSPLAVIHGLPEEPYGRYEVTNVWNVEDFRAQAIAALAEPTTWTNLFEILRLQFPRIQIPDACVNDHRLQGEPYSATIGDRVRELCSHLNDFMESRNADGSDSARTNELVRTLFTNAAGSEPVFTGESRSNQNEFRKEMIFPDPDDAKNTIFAHWHGKIRHRFFRMHFEWPVPRGSSHLKILYLGPKLTKG